MGNSNGRQKYFDKYCKTAPTAHAYVEALEKSPHKTHNRVAIGLREQLNQMSADTIEGLKKQEESNEFKKSLGL